MQDGCVTKIWDKYIHLMGKKFLKILSFTRMSRVEQRVFLYCAPPHFKVISRRPPLRAGGDTECERLACCQEVMRACVVTAQLHGM
jgi:hypothetical protein